MTEMEKMDLDSTAKLSFAGDMIMFLQKGLLEGDKVDKFDDEVEELEREVSAVWPLVHASWSEADVHPRR